jgi:methyl-accepting chemotaxis protein
MTVGIKGGHEMHDSPKRGDYARRPLANFFLKRSLQTGIILKAGGVLLLSALLTTALLIAVYLIRSRDGTFYFMSNDVMKDLELVSILGLVLPVLVTIQVINFLIAVSIGLNSSRKAALPVYKVEKWAALVGEGKLKTTLGFRKKDGLGDLALECNQMTNFYRRTLSDIRTSALEARSQAGDALFIREPLDAMLIQLDKLDF